MPTDFQDLEAVAQRFLSSDSAERRLQIATHFFTAYRQPGDDETSSPSSSFGHDSEEHDQAAVLSDSRRVSGRASLSMRTEDSEYSSKGQVLSSSRSNVTIRTMKIVPILDEKLTACSILNSPIANSFMHLYNKDRQLENDVAFKMDNEVQLYTPSEDDMITSGLGLMTGLKMKGAIPFKNFRTTFSSTKFVKGYYNSREGDIYIHSSFTLRADPCEVAARFANYFTECMNPAFGRGEEVKQDDQAYLEVPNDHSAVFKQDYNFPAPFVNREGIVHRCENGELYLDCFAYMH